MHSLESPFNISSVRPLNDPKECEKLYVEDRNYFPYAYGLKWNYADHEQVISRFYMDNDIEAFKRALYLIDAIGGNRAAYEFTKAKGRFKSVQLGAVQDQELLLLLLKVLGPAKAWREFGFVLKILCNGDGRGMPRGLGNPDLYVHASLNAEVAAHLISDGATEAEVGGLRDTVLVDVRDGSVFFRDCFKNAIDPGPGTAPVIVAMMRVRNESATIKFAITSIAAHVDQIVVFDDHSNDDTVARIEECKAGGLPIDLIRADAWLFNESLIHQILVDRGRELGGTHFIQVDADEVLSDEITPSVLRAIMSAMRPGDILALPWLNLTANMAAYYSEDRIIGLLPSRGLKKFKDVGFADDGFSQFPEWQYAHVNVAPFTYTRRFLSLNDSISLYHLEQISLVNFVAKKDWYRARAFDQNKKLPADPYLDIRPHLLQMSEATRPLDVKSSRVDVVNELFGSLTWWRIESNMTACEKYPVLRPNMYIDYEHFRETSGNNISEKR
ncbi:glycosyltransferase family protein [Sinorhizobium fredii]|uniref:hypothetical protein n=1 Tax=Rhizobium fredii TaxID=380 RepID=UPI0005956B32|nr:hypothetical protein [Sinorhizobium fredii]WOS65244.1 hypothetical protein SFGR64A_27310 [Sinorhizobium fredii GR64]